jgi:hypothetical protein
MKVATWVEWSDVVEVEITREDLLAVFSECPAETQESWLTVLHRFALALEALPDTMLATFPAIQRQAMHRFLTRHAARFADTALLPTHGEISP